MVVEGHCSCGRSVGEAAPRQGIGERPRMEGNGRKVERKEPHRERGLCRGKGCIGIG